MSRAVLGEGRSSAGRRGGVLSWEKEFTEHSALSVTMITCMQSGMIQLGSGSEVVGDPYTFGVMVSDQLPLVTLILPFPRCLHYIRPFSSVSDTIMVLDWCVVYAGSRFPL